MIRRLTVHHTAGAEYGALLAAEARLASEAPATIDQGHLHTFTMAGTGVLVGRYHAVPLDAHGRRTVPLYRRTTGGTVVPFGDGFLGLSLILPHRSALVSDSWRTLDAPQVMNRCVRGVLAGLKTLGVPAFYPGRDLITAGGRTLGAISFETTTAGALLFEAVIAVTRDFAALPRMLDDVDPRGVIRAPMYTSEQTVTATQAAGREVAPTELADRIAQGYADVFKIELASGATVQQSDPGGSAEDPDADASKWLLSRVPHATLDHHGTVDAQIGVLEAYLSRDGDRLGSVMLTGDFIANSSAVEEVERRLQGVRADWATITPIVFQTFARPENFILGLGELSLVSEAICNAGPTDRRST